MYLRNCCPLAGASILGCGLNLPEMSWVGTTVPAVLSVLCVSLSRHGSIHSAYWAYAWIYAFSVVFAVLLHAQNIPNCCQENFFTREVLSRNNVLLDRWFCCALQSFPWVRDIPLHMARISDGSEWLVFLEKSSKGTQLKHVKLIYYEACADYWGTLGNGALDSWWLTTEQT